MSSKKSIKELKFARYFCQSSLLNHTKYFFKEVNNKKFILNDHHEQICEALERVLRGECTRLIINIAPRYGKTELAVKQFISYALSKNPKAKFIHLSYSDSLALDNSEEIKDLVMSDEYQTLYPHVKIKPDSQSKKKWYTTQGGGVYATSSGGQVTGFGAGSIDNDSKEFGGAIIIDDPIKPDDLFSETIRNRINFRFDSTIRSRVNSRKTPIIIVMQRLHVEDLSGYLLTQEPDEWEVLSLPVIKEDGSALWEWKHNIDELRAMEEKRDFVFQTQYMQEPISLDAGALFPKNELRYFNPNEKHEFETSIAYADIADEGMDNTAITFGRNINGDIYITDVIYNPLLSEVTIPQCVQKAKEQELRYIRVESNNMGAIYSRNLRDASNGLFDVLTARSTTNKHTRILMEVGFIKKHCLFIAPEYQSEEYRAFMKELTTYNKNPDLNKGKHDDGADSLSGLVLFTRGVLPHVYLD